MKKIAFYFSLGATTLVLGGCGLDIGSKNYALSDISGNTYLMNNETGELSVIEKGFLIPLKKIDLDSSKLLEHDGLVGDKVNVLIKTKLIVNEVFYQVKLSPKKIISQDLSQGNSNVQSDNLDWFFENINKKDYTYNRVIINFHDKDGFTLDTHEVTLNEGFVRTVGEKNEALEANYTGSFSVNPYRMIKLDSISFTYSFSILENHPDLKVTPIAKK